MTVSEFVDLSYVGMKRASDRFSVAFAVRDSRRTDLDFLSNPQSQLALHTWYKLLLGWSSNPTGTRSSILMGTARTRPRMNGWSVSLLFVPVGTSAVYIVILRTVHTAPPEKAKSVEHASVGSRNRPCSKRRWAA
jgi:hypothetical protein